LNLVGGATNYLPVPYILSNATLLKTAIHEENHPSQTAVNQAFVHLVNNVPVGFPFPPPQLLHTLFRTQKQNGGFRRFQSP
jgi:hypothetical protein